MTDEYYCDVCETIRDPRIRFYCCMECKYFAHVHCVIPEIVKVMTGKLEPYVKLKTIGEDIWKVGDDDPFMEKGIKSTLTLKDLINNLPDYEKEALRKFYRWDDDHDDEKKKQGLASHDHNTSIAQDEYYKLLGDEDRINEILRLSRFNSDIEKRFMDELRQGSVKQKVKLRSSDLSLTIVKVKDGYMIPLELSGVLKSLINQHGNMMRHKKSSETTLEMKSFVYFILCQVVRRMRSILVKDIPKTLLTEWLCHLDFLRWNYYYEIYYLLLRPVRVVIKAFLGLQAKRLEDEIPKMLKKKISFLQEGLEKCEEYRGPSAKSQYMTDCLNKASQLESKHALEGFNDLMD